MGTIADKLTAAETTKAKIKTAIEQKGISVGDVPFRQYPDKIAEIESGGGTNPDMVMDFQKLLEDRLLEELNKEENKKQGFITGIIYGWKASDENVYIERSEADYVYPSNQAKYFYSDGFVIAAPHRHIMDTDKDIITPTGKYRYRLSIYKFVKDKLIWDYVFSIWNEKVLLSTGIEYIINYGWGHKADLFTEFTQLRVFKVINQYVYGTNLKSRLWFRGHQPVEVDGLDFTDMKGSGGDFYDVQIFKNIKNIYGDFSLMPYSSSISRESVLNIINALATYEDGATHTLKLPKDFIERRLSEDEIAIVTGKGWTLANS